MGPSLKITQKLSLIQNVASLSPCNTPILRTLLSTVFFWVRKSMYWLSPLKCFMTEDKDALRPPFHQWFLSVRFLSSGRVGSLRGAPALQNIIYRGCDDEPFLWWPPLLGMVPPLVKLTPRVSRKPYQWGYSRSLGRRSVIDGEVLLLWIYLLCCS